MPHTLRTKQFAHIKATTGLDRLDAIKAICTIAPDTECWTRNPAHGGKSQPRIMIDGRNIYLSVVAFTAKHGPIPDGKVLRNTCDTRYCLNPDHNHIVPAGTSRKNKKGKLTQEQAQAIVNDQRPHSEIARAFGISISHINRIKNGAVWENLKRPARSKQRVNRKRTGSSHRRLLKAEPEQVAETEEDANLRMQTLSARAAEERLKREQELVQKQEIDRIRKLEVEQLSARVRAAQGAKMQASLEAFKQAREMLRQG